MAKGYWVVQVDVTDLTAYANYRAFIDPFLTKRGARFVVRGGQQVVTEGSAYPRTIVVEFPSFAEAKAAYESAEYTEGRALRAGASETNFVIVEGTA